MRDKIKQSPTLKPSLLSFILAWPQVLRIKNVLMMTFLQFLLYTYILAPWAYSTHKALILNLGWLILIMLSTACIAAAGYLINDYYDQEIDEINVPQRRVIGKIIQPKLAFRTYIALNIIGIILALPLFYLHYSLPIIHTLSILILWLYARYLKAQPLIGNLMICLLCGLIAAEILLPDNLLLEFSNTLSINSTTEYYRGFAWQYIGFIMYANLLREWSKDIEDMAGDNKGKRKTLPLLFGWKTMRNVLIFGHILLSILLGLESWTLWQEAFHYSSAYVGILLCLSLLVPIFLMIFCMKAPKHFAVISGFLKIYFLFGLGWLLFFHN